MNKTKRQLVRDRKEESPSCGWMRVVSRRKDVECYKCSEPQMVLAKMDFGKYTEMSEEERKDYSDGWLYIHQKKH